MIDFYFTLPENEISKIYEMTQIEQSQVADGKGSDIEDYVYKKAKLVAKLNGYL